MRIGALIVCRMGSKRLPGKCLENISGNSLLWYILARCNKVEFFNNKIVVATTELSEDDAIYSFCINNGVECFRGDSVNVAGRVLAAAKQYGFDYFARINADSPFIDPNLLNKGCMLADIDKYDIVTNLYPRTFPYGVSVEIIRTSVFSNMYQKMAKPAHYEHITQIFYENMDSFSYYNILRNEGDVSNIRLVIDDKQDLAFYKSMVAVKSGVEISYEEVIKKK